MFLFERPKRNRKSRHRSESVDDGLGVLPPTPPPKINGRPSRQVLLPALPCRPGDTVLPWPVGRWRFFCVGAYGNAFLFGKNPLYLVLCCTWPQGFAHWQVVAGLKKQIRPQGFHFISTTLPLAVRHVPSARRVGPSIRGWRDGRAVLLGWSPEDKFLWSASTAPKRWHLSCFFFR